MTIIPDDDQVTLNSPATKALDDDQHSIQPSFDYQDFEISAPEPGPFMPRYQGDWAEVHSGLGKVAETPIAFYIYAVDSPKLSRDSVITGPHRSPIYYRQSFTRGFKSGTLMTLHRSDVPQDPGPVGVPLPAESPLLPSDNPILTITGKPRTRAREITFRANGFRTPFRREGGRTFATRKEFQGFPDTETGVRRKYLWGMFDRGVLRSRWVCKDEKTGDVVAVWRRTAWSRKKHGMVLINWNYRDEVELFLASAITLEGEEPNSTQLKRTTYPDLLPEWEREER
ncbi:hypothetical protein T439DRAFT_384566 [Meredithblackwellia eburnea MCA 4105]